MESEKKILCPSSTCKEGAMLIGIVLPDGTVAMSSTEYYVDADFANDAMKGRMPEQRFRFSSKCETSGCRNWDKQCTIIERVEMEMEELSERVPSEYVPPECFIRDQCRWYFQKGKDACFYCSFIVRNPTSLSN